MARVKPSYYPSRTSIERYHRNKQGESIEEVAKRDKVTQATVKTNIREVELWRSQRSVDLMNEDLSGIVINSARAVQSSLNDALTAENEFTTAEGEKISVPDHGTRLRAVSEVREIAKVVQPKNESHTNVNVGVGIAGGRIATASYVGMEDRLREIRKSRTEQPLLEENTVTATIIEGAPNGEDEDDAG
jgi:hypothetical protein